MLWHQSTVVETTHFKFGLLATNAVPNYYRVSWTGQSKDGSPLTLEKRRELSGSVVAESHEDAILQAIEEIGSRYEPKPIAETIWR